MTIDTSREAVERLRADTEKLGRFGHHPDPAIDFEIEVETLIARLFDAKHGTGPESITTVAQAINRAMDFRVGGDPGAVFAKATLRELWSEALATPAPDAPMPEHERDGFGRPVNPATPQQAVYLGQHSVAPAPDAVQEAARVPEIAALIEAAKALHRDMLERAQLKIDTISGEQYRIVNSGRTAWADFDAAIRAIAGDRT